MRYNNINTVLCSLCNWPLLEDLTLSKEASLYQKDEKKEDIRPKDLIKQKK